MRCRSVARALGVVCLMSTLVGCSFPSDYFGNRAIEYNREAEDATLSAMLLNIIRASQRRPMQFTGLQSVTGTSSTSGSISGSDQKAHTTPYLIPPATSVVSRVLTTAGSGTATISGGPTFTVPVLDTQEFYQGILTPIPLSVIDFYLEEGFPPELLADLFVLNIEVTRIDNGSCQHFVFRNNVSDDLQFGQFQAMVDYLVASGFIAERISRTTPYGPAIPLPRASDAARAVDAYAHAAQAGLDFKKDKKTGKYNLEKKSSELRTCFSYKGGVYPPWLAAHDKSIFCGNFQQKSAQAGQGAAGPECTPGKKLAANKSESTGGSGVEPGITAHGESEFRGIALAPQVLQRMQALQDALRTEQTPSDAIFPVRAFANAHISMKFHTRSTEGILYYLGEVVRRELAPERDGKRVMQAKVGLNYGTYPREDCVGQPAIADITPLTPAYTLDAMIPVRCENIFVVNEGPSLGNNVVSVSYNGAIYSIPHDRENGGRSSQVTELVKQVLNLNTSAKQLPSTTVISVVGAQ